MDNFENLEFKRELSWKDEECIKDYEDYVHMHFDIYKGHVSNVKYEVYDNLNKNLILNKKLKE